MSNIENHMNISQSVGMSISDDINHKFKTQKSKPLSEAHHRTQRAYKITKLSSVKRTVVIEDNNSSIVENSKAGKNKSRNSTHMKSGNNSQNHNDS